MTKVLAAIDNSAAARPVLETAGVLADLLGARAEALHAREDGAATAIATAEGMEIPLRLVDGTPGEAIIEAMEDEEVVIAVLGARGEPGGARPGGHIAIEVAQRAAKPIMVVPPEAPICAPGELRRVLVPLDGTEAAAAAVQETVHVFAGSGVEVVALHVFDAATVPRFLDRPEHDLAVWANEFLARYCAEPGSRLELRSGVAGRSVLDVAQAEEVDMIALGWSQDLSSGRAAVVRDVLSRACVPVLLVPVRAEVRAP